VPNLVTVSPYSRRSAVNTIALQNIEQVNLWVHEHEQLMNWDLDKAMWFLH
jgi:hypothetical protein